MINYAIVGGGRLARHFSEYFRLLDISHNCWTQDRWSRFNTFDLPGAEQRLKETVSDADHVLLLVADNAIKNVLKQYPFLREKYVSMISIPTRRYRSYSNPGRTLPGCFPACQIRIL